MRETIISRVRFTALLALFFLPVAVLEVAREVRAHLAEQNSQFLQPTPEFHTAMSAANELASADR